jgi:hypothetical protein
VAGAIAAVLVLVLGASLLMQVTKNPHIASPTASESASPNGTQAASAPASVARTTVVWFPGFRARLAEQSGVAEADFVIRYNATTKDNINLQLSLIFERSRQQPAHPASRYRRTG